MCNLQFRISALFVIKMEKKNNCIAVTKTSSGEVNANNRVSIKGIGTQGCGITLSTVSVSEVTSGIKIFLSFFKTYK